MGIYDQGRAKLQLKFGFSWKQVKLPVIGLAVIIIAIIALFSIALMLQPQAIHAELDPNPLDLAKGEMNSFLTVTISNVTDATARNVAVSVEATAEELVVYPTTREIETLEAGKYRTLNPFSIRPNPGKTVYSGTYELIIRTTINSENFEKRVTLELKAV